MKTSVWMTLALCTLASTLEVHAGHGSGFQKVRRSHRDIDHNKRAAAVTTSSKAISSSAATSKKVASSSSKAVAAAKTSSIVIAAARNPAQTSASKSSTTAKVVVSSSLSSSIAVSSTVVTTATVAGRAASSSLSSTSISSAPSSLSATVAVSTTSSAAAGANTTTPVAVLNVAPNPNFLQGVNYAGFDFGVDTNGNAQGFATPSAAQIAHFSNQGVNVYRLPFGWQYMQPVLGGPLDGAFFGKYDAILQAAVASGASVIVDVHNYARWNGGIIGQGGPTDEQFVNLWTQLAQKYASNPKVIFGLMNEPHDLDMIIWTATLQKVVNAIRATGANSQTILLPGTVYSSGGAFPKQSYPFLKTITDPAGGTSKLVFDLHQYLDGAGTGKDPECTTNNLGNFAYIYNTLKPDGRMAFLSETGGGDTDSCKTYLLEQLAYLLKKSDVFLGVTLWSAGAFSPTYALSMTPSTNPNGTFSDQPLWIKAVQPVLKAGGLGPK